MAHLLLLNGPNLNLLGTREPEIYGHQTLADIESMCENRAAELGLAIDFRQTNHEGVLVDWLHEAKASGAKAVLLNAALIAHWLSRRLRAYNGQLDGQRNDRFGSLPNWEIL